jgi:hypothetical protein
LHPVRNKPVFAIPGNGALVKIRLEFLFERISDGKSTWQAVSEEFLFPDQFVLPERMSEFPVHPPPFATRRKTDNVIFP